jgi:predicted Zn-dependent protease
MAAADPRLNAAIAALRRAAADPRAVVPRYNLALLLLRRGDRTEARKLLHAVLRLAPDFAPALFTQGRLALDARELGLAETLLRRALHAPGLTADVGVALAETLRRGGRIGEATALLRDLVAAAPREPDAYVNLAQLRLGEAPGSPWMSLNAASPRCRAPRSFTPCAARACCG